MREKKRILYDSENIFYFLNIIAASNILVLMFQREKRKYKHSIISFHLPTQEILKKILQILFNFMTWGVLFFSLDKNIILDAPTLIICKGWNF